MPWRRRDILTHGGLMSPYGDLYLRPLLWRHNGRVASQITGFTIVFSTVYSDADQRKFKAPRHWPGTGEFPAQMDSNAENVSIWWRHNVNICPSFLAAPTRHLNHCWLIISEILMDSPKGTLTENAQENNLRYSFDNYYFMITAASPSHWWFNAQCCLFLLVNFQRNHLYILADASPLLLFHCIIRWGICQFLTWINLIPCMDN